MSRLASLPSIMLAPNGARRGKKDHPSLPITVAETVEAARAGFEAGATALHAHVRDREGQHVLDAGLYVELIAEMKCQVPDMPVQITTEAAGIFSPEAQMSVVYDVVPEGASVSIRELWRDTNLHDKVQRFYRWCDEAGVPIQHILYDLSDVSLLTHLVDIGTLPEPRQCIFVVGSYARARDGEPNEIWPLLNACQNMFPDVDWALCAFGSMEHECLAAAARAGGKLRVGFENSLSNGKDHMFEDNAASVRALLRIRSLADNLKSRHKIDQAASILSGLHGVIE